MKAQQAPTQTDFGPLFAAIRGSHTAPTMGTASETLVAHPDCTWEVIASFLTGKENADVRLPPEPDDSYEPTPTYNNCLGANRGTWAYNCDLLFHAMHNKGATFEQMLAVYESPTYLCNFSGREPTSTGHLEQAFLQKPPVEQLAAVEKRMQEKGPEKNYSGYDEPMTHLMFGWFLYQLDHDSELYHMGRTLDLALSGNLGSDDDQACFLAVIKRMRILVG
jgi:hypothetical protein